MVRAADENVAGRNIGPLGLGVTTQAKVQTVVHEQLFVYGSMRVVTRGATLAQRFVLKDHGPGLCLVTTRAAFVLPSHCEATCRLEDVAAVRVVAIHAIHEAFSHRMMLRQIEFRLDVEMALETGVRFFAGVDNEGGAAAGADMFAARSVAGFTTALPRHSRALNMQARMRAGGKFADDVGVAIGAGLVADVVCAGNLKRCHNRRRMGGA